MQPGLHHHDHPCGGRLTAGLAVTAEHGSAATRSPAHSALPAARHVTRRAIPHRHHGPGFAAACLAGVQFRVRRVGVPDPVRAANVAWLARYRHQRCGSQDVARLLLKVFAEPAPLMAGAAAAGDPLAVLPVLFHLMWEHVLVTDLAVRFTAETPVRVGGVPGGAR